MFNRHNNCNCPPHGHGNVYYNTQDRRGRRPYGCMSFIFDIIMLVITGGLWLLWIFIREMRSR